VSADTAIQIPVIFGVSITKRAIERLFLVTQSHPQDDNDSGQWTVSFDWPPSSHCIVPGLPLGIYNLGHPWRKATTLWRLTHCHRLEKPCKKTAMSTLELIWDAQKTYKLWSWTSGSVHYVARFIRRLDGRNNLCTVRIGERGSSSAPRSNTDENAGVAVIKLAFTPEGSQALAREAQFYAQMLNVQGSAVPRCLGHFRSKVAGSEMSCLVLDYCTGMPGEQMRDP
jgi:hypothetical protein